MTQHMTTTRILELLHMDLIRPMQVESLGGKRYAFVCGDEFFRYSWLHFLKGKSDTFDAFEALILRLMLEKNVHHKKVVRIRGDHRREFENSQFYSNKQGIRLEFSAPKIHEHNGVIERKNITLQEMVCVMLKAKKVPIQFWAEALNTVCHIQN